MKRFWPKSLTGQLVLSLALALMLAQLINGAIIYRTQKQQSENQVAAGAALRLLNGWDRLENGRPLTRQRRGDDQGRSRGRGRGGRGNNARFDLGPVNPVTADMPRLTKAEEALATYLSNNGITAPKVAISYSDAPLSRDLRLQRELINIEGQAVEPRGSVLAAVQRDDGQWLSARYSIPRRANNVTGFLIMQTVIIFLVLFIPMLFIIRRISRPMLALTKEVKAFRDTQQPVMLEPSGPSDVSDLTKAFNDMSARISAMINEKDVMLGAIGHDLKTPLAALRVRLESVDDDSQRGKMIAGVEDINRTLDDILTLARVGHPLEAPETTNLTALVETIAEEFDDLGKPVSFADAPRIVLPLHVTWMRRAIRNLVSNAVRYGHEANISLVENETGVILSITDKGPGIAEGDIARMFEPFTRLEESRNQATGGSGLGLTLAKAIAEQHGATLILRNIQSHETSEISGLSAQILFPKTSS